MSHLRVLWPDCEILDFPGDMATSLSVSVPFPARGRHDAFRDSGLRFAPDLLIDNETDSDETDSDAATSDLDERDSRRAWPDVIALGVVRNEPTVVPFSTTGFRRSRVAEGQPSPPQGETVSNPVERARLLFLNRCCRTCGHPVVSPIELADGAFNSAGLPIPGTATLVGFRCHGCGSEWAATTPRTTDAATRGRWGNPDAV